MKLAPAILVGAMGLGLGCGGTDDRPARWSYISPAIIQPSCATASCHSRVAHQADVRLDKEQEGYEALVPEPTMPTAARGFVAPGDPDRSKLMYMLRGEDTLRMPRDEPLPDADIALIERWIWAGAVND